MAIPGFTAEASVGPTKEVYRVHTQYGHELGSGDGLYPQQSLNGGMGGTGWAGIGAGLEGLEASGGDAWVAPDDDAEVVADDGSDDAVAADDLGAGTGVGEAPGDDVALGAAEDVVGVDDDLDGGLGSGVTQP